MSTNSPESWAHGGNCFSLWGSVCPCYQRPSHWCQIHRRLKSCLFLLLMSGLWAKSLISWRNHFLIFYLEGTLVLSWRKWLWLRWCMDCSQRIPRAWLTGAVMAVAVVTMKELITMTTVKPKTLQSSTTSVQTQIVPLWLFPHVSYMSW